VSWEKGIVGVGNGIIEQNKKTIVTSGSNETKKTSPIIEFALSKPC
jgi:hypothetical protein